MEESIELTKYLPVSYRTPSEQEYIKFLWDAFETNYANGKYQFAFLAFHMLMMSFVYFNIWQIKQTSHENFEVSLVGFGKEMENAFIAATSPFVFSRMSERSVLRFLKLIACDNGKIGRYQRLVDARNDVAHSNGNIFLKEQSALDDKIDNILHMVDEIQGYSKPTIESCYRNFLLQNHDPDQREYLDDDEQIVEILIHNNYMSQMDIEICASFDVHALSNSDNFDMIKTLHESLISLSTTYW